MGCSQVLFKDLPSRRVGKNKKNKTFHINIELMKESVT